MYRLYVIQCIRNELLFSLLTGGFESRPPVTKALALKASSLLYSAHAIFATTDVSLACVEFLLIKHVRIDRLRRRWMRFLSILSLRMP